MSPCSTRGDPIVPPPDFGGAEDVTHDNVEGVDIIIPVYSFSETHSLDAAFVTPACYGTLFNLTGKVNDALFKGLIAGECLFLGASGSKRGAEDWEALFMPVRAPESVLSPVERRRQFATILAKGVVRLRRTYQTRGVRHAPESSPDREIGLELFRETRLSVEERPETGGYRLWV